MKRVRENVPIILEHKDGLTPSGKAAWTWFHLISVGDRFREVIPNDPRPGETTHLGSTVFTKIDSTHARTNNGREIGTFDERKKINFTHPSIQADTEPHDVACRCRVCAPRGGR